MKLEYKRYKDSLSRSGAGRCKEPRFFDIMDGFLGDRPEAQGLKNSVDTSGDAGCSTSLSEISEDSNMGDLDDELIRKYGEGKIIERECPQCNEKIELKTAGAHVGNSIAVYSEDQNLVCPYCHYTEEVQDEEDEKSQSTDKKAPASLGEKDKIPSSDKKKPVTGKGKPSKMQVAFQNAMKDHHAYLRESDQNFLSELKEQAEKERELQREEVAAYKDYMALLANAIAGRQHVQNFEQPPFYAIEHDNQQTYYKL